MYAKIKNWFLIFVCCSFFWGCEALEEDKRYNFIGDSIINYWPIDETFPSRLVYNYGKPGAGVEYLNEYKGAFKCQDVVVIIGTNDNHIFYKDEIVDYSLRYIDIITSLTDGDIYLFSVLPREAYGDKKDINDKIKVFNDLIRNLVPGYANIHYIDVFDDFMWDSHINYQYYSDGLHLNIFGYECLTQRLLKVLD